MRLIIVSGRSGSGKSVCLHVLEDMGFYCIDNLPLSLLSALVSQITEHKLNAAVGIDARNLSGNLHEFPKILAELKQKVRQLEVVYLDAEEQILLKRFSETRRKHPLSSDQISLQEALQQESIILEAISYCADLRLDSSYLSVQEFRELVRSRVAHKTHDFSLLFESFGYKFGVPLDVDYVFDVRCLPNPYWVPNLREYTGLQPEIAEFLQKQTYTQQLIEDIQKFLQTWISKSTAEKRTYLTVAIGCTGGQHRSVYVVEKLAEYFRQLYPEVQVRHREL